MKLIVDSPFKIDVVSTNFLRGVSTSNRWGIDEDLPIGKGLTVQEVYGVPSLIRLKCCTILC